MKEVNEIIDRFIETDGSVAVMHKEFGFCILINLDLVSERAVILDTNGIEHRVTLSDLTLVD